jgi:hypothetical protein
MNPLYACGKLPHHPMFRAFKRPCLAAPLCHSSRKQ